MLYICLSNFFWLNLKITKVAYYDIKQHYSFVADKACADEFRINKAFSLCNVVAIRLFQ